MKYLFDRIARRWRGEGDALFDRAVVLVRELTIQPDNRPECPNTGWIGYLEGDLVDTLQDVQLFGPELRLVRFNGRAFVDDEHEVLRSEPFCALLLPGGVCVKL